MAGTGSKYVLGDRRLTDIAQMEVGKSDTIVLNPLERSAYREVAKTFKAIFSRQGRGCSISSRKVLVEHEDGVWLATSLMTITATATPPTLAHSQT